MGSRGRWEPRGRDRGVPGALRGGGTGGARGWRGRSPSRRRLMMESRLSFSVSAMAAGRSRPAPPRPARLERPAAAPPGGAEESARHRVGGCPGDNGAGGHGGPQYLCLGPRGTGTARGHGRRGGEQVLCQMESPGLDCDRARGQGDPGGTQCSGPPWDGSGPRCTPPSVSWYRKVGKKAP